MTENARDRLRRFAWGTAWLVVFFAAWYPANWLAGRVIPGLWNGCAGLGVRVCRCSEQQDDECQSTATGLER